jgi:CubicO group peptidase (beta-lactamase class C family)/D-alanyl-D-alanine dipeptidase
MRRGVVRWAGFVLVLLVLFPAPGRGADDASDVPPIGPYKAVVEALDPFLEQERRDKGLPALSIALVDDQKIVWAKGFGVANREKKVPATAATLYRVGSVSKSLTGLAVLQLVERGLLDLDAPIGRSLPDFRPKNPFPTPITARQLMSHRSGLVREPPIGNFIDPDQPSLAETVRSLNQTTLVFEPGTRTKYSNAGVAVLGVAVEKARQRPFEQAMRREVLGPLGMADARFGPAPELADGLMWTLDGRTFPAPKFALGIAPASDLSASVLDLGRFLQAVFAEGRGPGGAVVKPETIRAMWRPQAGPGGGFGLGFALGTLDGRERIGHAGAVYGFATELASLPGEKLGVAVVATRDCANGTTCRVADQALRLMLAARAGKPLPEIPRAGPLADGQARELEGRYADRSDGVDLVERDGRLFLTPLRGGTRVELRAFGDHLAVDDRLAPWAEARVVGDRLELGGRSFPKVEVREPSPAPARFLPLIGEYGRDYDILYILEKDGRLHALIEWFFLYPLEEVGADVYKFPDAGGLYEGETLAFRRDGSGKVVEATVAGVVFRRRPLPGEAGETFRVKPLRPIEVLRAEAIRALPPAEAGAFRKPDLVDVAALDPTIKLDIRYATTNNFLGTPFYSSARAFLQRPAAEALVRAHRKLAGRGLGFLIHDAYRPWYVTKMFWDATNEADHKFVADPSKGSKHNRGAAVDLTLYDLRTVRPVPMVGGYDEFSDRSNPDYPGGTSLQRHNRDILRRALEAEGFAVNEAEWWHFDHKDWAEYAIQNVPFERLAPAAPRGRR